MNDDGILHRLEDQGVKAPHVDLSDPERAVRQASARRYQVLGELARGGIGVVHQGRDHDLGREVAIKVLHKEHVKNRDLVQRFVEEAQIGGQLQHPGIVPVYELGLQDDRRPYFAMKLVKGDTLANLLDRRATPGEDRRALLKVFRDVCRTVSYAHARGVIHRDLKPANVMIGGFGEVQVVDWGFAKVLARGGVADERLRDRAAPDATLIATVRTAEGSSASVAGSVMGTPAYMPPEQALGRVDDLDERSDVFSLGAILCEILTGSPPYTGDKSSVMTAAAHAELGGAHAALESCDADSQLTALCRRCLEPIPKQRPPNAEVLADEVARWLTVAEGIAHRAELDEIEAEAQAEEQHRARRQTRRVAAGVVGVVAVAIGLFVFVSRDRAARELERRTAISSAIEDATRLRAAGAWTQALAATERAVALGADDALVEELRGDVAAGAAAERIAADDEAILEDLEQIRGAWGEALPVDGDAQLAATIVQGDAATDAAYEAAFGRRFGSVEASAERLLASRQAEAFAANLGFWCWIRKTQLEAPGWEPIDALARRIDPGHAAVRDALNANDVDALIAIAEREGDDLPLVLAADVGTAIASDPERGSEALAFFRRQVARAPDDFWIHRRYAQAALDLGQFELAARHFTAALAIRPRHPHTWCSFSLCFFEASDPRRRDKAPALSALRRAAELAWNDPVLLTYAGGMISNTGEWDEAIPLLQRAIELDPEHGMAHENLGITLLYAKQLEAGLAELQRSVELDPDGAKSYSMIGFAYLQMGRFEDAIPPIRRAIELETESERPRTLVNLASALHNLGRDDEALECVERAFVIAPDDPITLAVASHTLMECGEHERALAAVQRALELDPTLVRAHANLAGIYRALHRLPEAAEALRTAVSLQPEYAMLRADLATVLAATGDFAGAFEAASRALELDPNNVRALTAAGRARLEQGDPDGAEASLRRAIECDPDFTEAQVQLGSLLGLQGRHDEAIPHFRRAYELDPNHENAGLNLAFLLSQRGQAQEALEISEDQVARHPENARAHHHYGGLLWYVRRDRERGLAELRRAREIDLEKNDFEGLTRVGQTLMAMGDRELALETFHRAAEIGSNKAPILVELGGALSDAGELQPAVEVLRRAIANDENLEVAQRYLGITLRKLDDRDGAIAAFRRAIELGPSQPGAVAQIGGMLFMLGAPDDAELALRRARMMNPSDPVASHFLPLVEKVPLAIAGEDFTATPKERIELAICLYGQREFVASARQYELAMDASPALAEDPNSGNIYNAACAAAMAGDAWREQAIAWLRDALGLLQGMAVDQPGRVGSILPHWFEDPDLAPVRDVEPLPPGAEELWRDARALLDEVRSGDR